MTAGEFGQDTLDMFKQYTYKHSIISNPIPNFVAMTVTYLLGRIILTVITLIKQNPFYPLPNSVDIVKEQLIY